VLHVVEYERGRLIDRGCARAGGRVGLGAGVDGKRCKPGFAVGHLVLPLVIILTQYVNMIVYRKSDVIYAEAQEAVNWALHRRRLH
jgi:hypothetical protein